jgi:hypothetical protein
MSELFNIRHRSVPSDAVNIMRPGKWGNPFEEKVYGREGCIELYEHMLFENPETVAMMRAELAGKDLVCCCWPKACHGNVILRILKGEEPQPLPEDHPLLLKVYGTRRDPLKDALKRYEQLSNNPAPPGDGGTTAAEYEALLDGLVPHLRRLVAGRQPTPAPPEGATLEQYKEAFNLWHDKTEWVQKELNSGAIGAKVLGQHRADAILSLVAELRAEVEALKAAATRSEGWREAMQAADDYLYSQPETKEVRALRERLCTLLNA